MATIDADYDPKFNRDLLYGADAIAEFLFGDKKYRRKVFYLVEHTKIPVFRIGARICGRRSTLLKWIGDQEGVWGYKEK